MSALRLRSISPETIPEPAISAPIPISKAASIKQKKVTFGNTMGYVSDKQSRSDVSLSDVGKRYG